MTKPVVKTDEKTSTSKTTEQSPRVRLGDALSPWAKTPKVRIGDALMPW